jgi:peptide/nickel transport system substrate-binding protein
VSSSSHGRPSVRRPRPPRRRGPAALTAGALAVALAAAGLSGCSGDGPAPTSADLVHADRGRIVTGGTLHWAVDAVPATLNAFQPDATDTTALIDQAVLPTLFTLDEHARATPDADYLTGAQLTSRSPQTVVYHLNPKAVWSDGAPISAADFIAQWQALRGHDPAYRAVRADGYDSISSVRQGTSRTDVEVTFGKPYAPWKRLFSPLYPAAVTATPAAFNEGARTRLAADAGPFTFKQEQSGGVTVVRNPRWWGDRAKLDAIDFTAVAPGARADALRAGRLDIADVSAAVENGGTGISTTAASDAALSAESQTYTQVQSIPGVTLHRASAPAYLALTLNGGGGPLADPQLRRAVAEAVDRQQLADAVLKPLGLPAVALGNHLVMADQQGYQDDSDALDSGTGSAATLLDADGWRTPVHAAANAARAKGGHPLSLKLVTRAGSAVDAQIAALLTARLAQVGVPVVTDAVPGSTFFTDHVASGDFDLALFTWPASRVPVADEVPLYAKPSVALDGTPVNGENLSGTGTDEVDQLLAQAEAALSPGTAARLTTEADTRIWQESPSVPLFQHPQLVAVRDTVSNAGAFGFATPRFQDLGFTALPASQAGGAGRAAASPSRL